MHIDPKEIKRLYDIGREMGLKQTGWRNRPPDLEERGENLPRMGTELTPLRAPEPAPVELKEEVIPER